MRTSLVLNDNNNPVSAGESWDTMMPRINMKVMKNKIMVTGALANKENYYQNQRGANAKIANKALLQPYHRYR